MTNTSLAPTTMNEAMDFSNMLATSNIVPESFKNKPADILVAIQWGMELGLQPMQALQNIAVINGKPSIWGDALLAIVRADARCLGVHEEIKGEVATCTIKRQHADGSVEPVTATFSMTQAKTAGLADKKGPWTNYPRRMLQMRARGFAIRDAFPDLLKGIISAEEAEDTPPPTKLVTGLDSVALPKAPTTEKLVGDVLEASLEPPDAADIADNIVLDEPDDKWMVMTESGKIARESRTQAEFATAFLDIIANCRRNPKNAPLVVMRHWLAQTKEANIVCWNELDATMGEPLEEDYQRCIKYFSAKIGEEGGDKNEQPDNSGA